MSDTAKTEPKDAAVITTAKPAARQALITSFSPNLMSEETLRALFVSRQKLIDRIVRDIRDATTSQARRHTMLVGPRGAGKSTLVTLVYYTLRHKKQQIYSKLRIAWLREEEWSVFSWADLLVRIFHALALEYPKEREDLNRTAERLRVLPIEQGEREGEQELLAFLGDRLLVLIAENFDDLLANMGLDGQNALRAFLHNTSSAFLLVTTPTLAPELSEHEAPFFGFFNTTQLKELTLPEARQLLANIATYQGDTELVAYLETPEAQQRLKVIETLAGGHPRIWILFSGCLTKTLLDELVPLFVKMLDDLTPYYQERMRALPPQERRIVAFLCERQGGIPVKEVAEACRLKPNACAVLLRNLAEKGYVRTATESLPGSTGDRRVTYYEMREPLMRLCLQVKESRATPLKIVVEFLRLWFREEELREWLEKTPAKSAPLTHEYLNTAIVRQASVRADLERLFNEFDNYYYKSDYHKALLTCNEALRLEPNNAFMWSNRGVTLATLNRYRKAIVNYDKAIEIEPNNSLIWNNRGAALAKLQLYEKAIVNYDKAIEIEPDNAMAWRNRGISLGSLQRYEDAINSSIQAIEIEPDSLNAWHNLSVTRYRQNLIEEGQEYRQIEEAISAGIQIIPIAACFTLRRQHIQVLQVLRNAFATRQERTDDVNDTNTALIEEQAFGAVAALFLRSLLATSGEYARWANWIEMLTAMFAEGGLLPQLSNALTRTIKRLYGDGITEAVEDAWLSAWEAATKSRPEMDIAMRLLRAAIQWKRTRDRDALLRLSQEERAVLEDILQQMPGL